MALNIKDAETDRLARELAALTGESITVAARTAVAERLAKVRRHQSQRGSTRLLMEIAERGRARRRLSELSEDEILGYGTDGLPR